MTKNIITIEQSLQDWKERQSRFLSRFQFKMRNRRRCITIPTGDNNDECTKELNN